MSRTPKSYLKDELTEFIKAEFPTTKLRNEAKLKLSFSKSFLWEKLKELGLIDKLPPPIPKELRPKRGKSKAIQIVETDKSGKTVSRTFKPLSKEELKPYDLEVDCEIRGMKTLMTHQRKFSGAFLNSNFRGAIAIHGVGSGKTLSAVVASQCYLDLYPENNVVFISPASLISNFQRELFYFYYKSLADLEEVGLGKYNPLTDPRFKFYSFEGYSRSPQLCNNSLMIIDEAHNLRSNINIIPIEREVEDSGGNKIKVNVPMATRNIRGFNILENCGKLAHKVLLLTGTPYINKPDDIENLMAIIDGREPNYDSEIYKFDKINEDLKEKYNDYFGYKVSLFIPSEEWKKKNFPERRDNYVFFNLDEDELEKYKDTVENLKDEVLEEDPENENPNAFYSIERQAVNTYNLATKIRFISTMVGENDTDKTLIYSNFLSSGSKVVADFLGKKFPGLSIGFINSKIPKSERDRVVKDYNEDKIRVVFISRAGAEGLSFIKTKNVFVLEPNWNQALIEQVVARGIRAGSHKMLDEKDRYVNAYYLITSTTEASNLVVKYMRVNNIPFYYIWYLDIGEKVNVKRLTGEEIKEIEDLPVEVNLNAVRTGDSPIDIRILALSLKKQNLLNTCLDLIGEVPPVEDAGNEVWFKINQIREEYFEKNGKEMPYRDILKIKRELLDNMTDKQTKIQEILSRSYWKLLLDEFKIRSDKPLDQETIQLYNFFPTPLNVIEKMIKVSDIENETRQSIQCLEPTAGLGSIPARIYDIMRSKKVVELKFDFIELLEENRQSLIKIFKGNSFTRLLEQPDFLKADLSTSYDYIFMNPPYNIKDFSTGKSVKDIDFVDKAYSYLKDGGKLIAVITPRYKDDADFMSKYKDYIYHEEKLDKIFKEAKETEGVFKKFKAGVSTVLIAMKKPEIIENIQLEIEGEEPKKEKPKKEIKPIEEIEDKPLQEEIGEPLEEEPIQEKIISKKKPAQKKRENRLIGYDPIENVFQLTRGMIKEGDIEGLTAPMENEVKKRIIKMARDGFKDGEWTKNEYNTIMKNKDLRGVALAGKLESIFNGIGRRVISDVVEEYTEVRRAKKEKGKKQVEDFFKSYRKEVPDNIKKMITPEVGKMIKDYLLDDIDYNRRNKMKARSFYTKQQVKEKSPIELLETESNPAEFLSNVIAENNEKKAIENYEYFEKTYKDFLKLLSGYTQFIDDYFLKGTPMDAIEAGADPADFFQKKNLAKFKDLNRDKYAIENAKQYGIKDLTEVIQDINKKLEKVKKIDIERLPDFWKSDKREPRYLRGFIEQAKPLKNTQNPGVFELFPWDIFDIFENYQETIDLIDKGYKYWKYKK